MVKGHGILWSNYAAFDKYIQYVILAESIDKFRLFEDVYKRQGPDGRPYV